MSKLVQFLMRLVGFAAGMDRQGHRKGLHVGFREGHGHHGD